jgi:rubrerythrin
MSAVHTDILAALTAGIQSEVAAYVFYREAIKKVTDNEIRSLLEKLAGEEKGHFRILERQYDSLLRSEKWISTADILKQDGLPEINEEMTSVHKDLAEKVRAAKTKHEILDMALQLEIDARELFRNTAEKSASKEAKDIFEQLSRFEDGHVNLVKSMIAQLG